MDEFSISTVDGEDVATYKGKIIAKRDPRYGWEAVEEYEGDGVVAKTVRRIDDLINDLPG